MVTLIRICDHDENDCDDDGGMYLNGDVLIRIIDHDGNDCVDGDGKDLNGDDDT